ncbi:hypothetical protein ACFW4X_06330 [Streptomyces smyrnaeus]|uniref:hypothetical protein n=1 Tax=Streptomyces smyrnaeus TaxID=1387713 RepID=UPI0036AFD345
MTDEQSEQRHQQRADAAPWWAGTGPVGGVVLILLGVGAGLALFLGGFDSQDELTQLHGAAKVVAVGLVVAGTTLLARRRRPGDEGDAAGSDG